MPDVNVLASGFAAESGVPATLINHWTELTYELVLSEHILVGLQRTWQKPYFQRRYPAERIQQTLDLLRTEASLVVPLSTVHGVAEEDEEDDLVLATAVSGAADFLVAGDHALQELGRYQRCVILTPRQFLTVLDDSDGAS